MTRLNEMSSNFREYFGCRTNHLIAPTVIVILALVGISAMFDELDGKKPLANREPNNIKIAVATDGRTLNSNVADEFGGAKYFLIVDLNTGKYKAIRNPYRGLGNSAGIQAAQLVMDESSIGVITVKIRSDAYTMLINHGLIVNIVNCGPAKNAIREFKEDRLTTAPNYTASQFFDPGVPVAASGYYHCPNCDTTVPCPKNDNGNNRISCPSCGVQMNARPGRAAASRRMGAGQFFPGANINFAGGFGAGLGTGGNLICPECGLTVLHQAGVPAYSIYCQKCGTTMVRQQNTNFSGKFYSNNNSNFQGDITKTAPPISIDAVMMHEYRGVCSKCHQIIY